MGWIIWKHPELIDAVIPWVVFAFLWHVTWEIAGNRAVHSRINRFKERRGRMVWLVAFLVGGDLSLGYLGASKLIVSAIGKSEPAPRAQADDPSIEIKRNIQGLPLIVGKNERAYLVVCTPEKNVLAFNLWNRGKGEMSWPEILGKGESKPQELFEYELTNKSKTIVYNARVIFKFDFFDYATNKAVSSTFFNLDLGMLPPANPFFFFVANQSAYAVNITVPDRMALQVEGEASSRPVPLQLLIRNPVDAVPIPLHPTVNKWFGNDVVSGVIPKNNPESSQQVKDSQLNTGEWKISPNDSTNLRQYLEKHFSQDKPFVSVSCNATDIVAFRFAKQLIALLKEAGFGTNETCVGQRWRGEPFYGVAVVVQTASKTAPEAALTLRDSFMSINLSTSDQIQVDTIPESKQDNFRIEVGARPPFGWLH